MQVQRVQGNNNYNLNQNFTGKIVNTYAVKKFIAGLKSTELDTFANCVNDIGLVNDGKEYIFTTMITGNKKVAKIYRANSNGEPINPPMFIDFNDNPINVFKKLAGWYKKYAISRA